MKGRYILTIDQSTSATKVVLVDQAGKIIAKKNESHRQIYPHPGWVEQDPVEIYRNTVKLINSITRERYLIDDNIAGLAITNQRESVVIWDKNTGKPVYNVVVWQCQRGRDICHNLKEQGYEGLVRDKTGLILDPYFSASKIKWIIDNNKEIKEKAYSGDLLFGTIDSWLIWNLTGGEIHATDYSNASRTLLYNIKELRWDNQLFEMFNIPTGMAPAVRSSNKIFGYTDVEGLFYDGIPIAGVAGDSHAALFGQSCFETGTAKATYGTGSSVVMNIGKEYRRSDKGVVTSLAWGIDGEVNYIFEGNVHSTGATLKWLKDRLSLYSDDREIEQLAGSLEDNGGVYFVPAFVGLGAPYWKSDAKAIITGLTFSSSKAHIVRSALEAIAYQIKDVLDLMINESGINLKELRVDGGPTRNDFLLQFQADMLNIPVNRVGIEEVSALGSTYLAGLAVGFWNSLEEIKELRGKGETFFCTMGKKKRKINYEGWKDAVKKTMRN